MSFAPKWPTYIYATWSARRGHAVDTRCKGTVGGVELISLSWHAIAWHAIAWHACLNSASMSQKFQRSDAVVFCDRGSLGRGSLAVTLDQLANSGRVRGSEQMLIISPPAMMAVGL